MELILFEGIDGSGKTTLAMATYNKLTQLGYNCLLVREPGGTKIGEQIRRIILENKDILPISQTLLFFAAREEIYRYLDNNTQFDYVLFDRSHYSTFAMQLILNEGLYDIYKLLVNKKYQSMERCIVFIDKNPSQINKKYEDDTFESKGVAFQHKIYKKYKDIFCVKNNVLSVNSFHIETNIDKILNYLNIGVE